MEGFAGSSSARRALVDHADAVLQNAWPGQVSAALLRAESLPKGALQLHGQRKVSLCTHRPERVCGGGAYLRREMCVCGAPRKAEPSHKKRMDLQGAPAKSYSSNGRDVLRRRRRAPGTAADSLSRSSNSSSSSSSLLCNGCYSRTRRPAGLRLAPDHWSVNYCANAECCADTNEKVRQDDETPRPHKRAAIAVPPVTAAAVTSPGGLWTEEG